MDKQEIITELHCKLSSGNFKYSKWELVAVIDPFIEILIEALRGGKEIHIKNLGKFSVKIRKERKFYNVWAKKIEYSQEKTVVVFTPSRNLQIKTNMPCE